MKVTCVALEQGGVLRPEESAAVVAGWRAGRGPYWIHLSAGAPEQVAGWLVDLGLDRELIGLLRLESQETGILPMADAVFISYPVPAANDGSPAQFRFLCLDRLLVTMHSDGAGPPLLDEAPLTRLRLREGTTANVVCALVLAHAGRTRRRVMALRAEADQLAVRMDADPWAVRLAALLDFKRRVLVQGGVVDEELAILEFLKAGQLEVLPLSRLADALQVAVQVTRTTERDVDRLDRRALDLHRRHEFAEQDRLNRRLGLLTVISAIFMPLTLITGIYGMNFELMPELHYRYSYPVVLAVMAALAAGLTWYFRTRWWEK